MKIDFAPLFARPTYRLPGAPFLNLLVEDTPFGKACFQRPAMLHRTVTPGTGPIRGVFKAPGVGGDNIFIVSGQQLFLRENLVGTVAGRGPVRFAASDTEVVIVGGGKAYCFLSANHAFGQITDPDLPAVSDVFQLGGRFYFVTQDDDRIWWSDLSEAKSIDGLAFFTAESQPDAVVAAIAIGDQGVFLGQDTLEFWTQTGDNDNPLEPGMGRKFDKGCAAQASVVIIDNSFIFVGSDRVVYRHDDVPMVISTPTINEALRSCTDLANATAWSVSLDGHLLYVLNLPDVGSYAYDCSNQTWAEWSMQGYAGMRLSCAVTVDGEAWLGDAKTNQLWKLGPGVHLDGGEPIVKMVSAWAPLPGGTQPCSSILLECARGADSARYALNPPMVEMSYSDDAGRTWSSWRPAYLGTTGRTLDKAIWRQLGLIRSPGRGFRFRSSDAVNFSCLYVTIDEPKP